jgi:hypothetical protein
MALGAIRAFLAVAKPGKGSADGSSWVNSDVGISTVIIRAVATQKMQTSRYAVGVGLVREITSIT